MTTVVLIAVVGPFFVSLAASYLVRGWARSRGFVDVPRNVKRDGVMGELGEQTEFQYEFLGTAPGEHLFLLSQESAQTSQLLILNAGGRVVRRRTLEIDYDEVIYRDFHISDTGILSALLATREDVRIVWWRTDKLFPGGTW